MAQPKNKLAPVVKGKIVIPPENMEYAREICAQAKCITDIARDLGHGVCTRYIRAWLREAGLRPDLAETPVSRPRKDKQDETDRRLCELWRTDLSRAELMAIFGWSAKTLQHRRRLLQLPDRPRDYADNAKPWSKADIAHLTRLIERGARTTAIAKTLGRGVHAVRGKAQELGLKRRTARGRDLPELLAEDLKQILAERGPQPAWRLRDLTRAADTRVVQAALRRLQRANLVAYQGGARDGAWALVRR